MRWTLSSAGEVTEELQVGKGVPVTGATQFTMRVVLICIPSNSERVPSSPYLGQNFWVLFILAILPDKLHLVLNCISLVILIRF